MRPAFEHLTPDQLDSQIAEILDSREQAGKPLTIERLAYELGVDVHTLALYRTPPTDETGAVKAAYAAYSAPIKRAYSRVQAWLVEQTMGPRPIGPMFALKCGWGYVEEEKRRGSVLGSTGDPIRVEVRLVGSGSSGAAPELSPAKQKVKPKKTAARKSAKSKG